MNYLFAIVLVICASAHAKTIRMVQADKVFLGDITDAQAQAAFEDPSIEEAHQVKLIDAKVGDTLEFANRDEVNHNVSGTLGATKVFDVKLQAPGKANDRSVELTKKGVYDIQCAIHPKMKFKVKVD